MPSLFSCVFPALPLFNAKMGEPEGTTHLYKSKNNYFNAPTRKNHDFIILCIFFTPLFLCKVPLFLLSLSFVEHVATCLPEYCLLSVEIQRT